MKVRLGFRCRPKLYLVSTIVQYGGFMRCISCSFENLKFWLPKFRKHRWSVFRTWTVINGIGVDKGDHVPPQLPPLINRMGDTGESDPPEMPSVTQTCVVPLTASQAAGRTHSPVSRSTVIFLPFMVIMILVKPRRPKFLEMFFLASPK